MQSIRASFLQDKLYFWCRKVKHFVQASFSQKCVTFWHFYTIPLMFLKVSGAYQHIFYDLGQKVAYIYYTIYIIYNFKKARLTQFCILFKCNFLSIIIFYTETTGSFLDRCNCLTDRLYSFLTIFSK